MSDDMYPPAAWLPDPDDPAMYRYWDGERWTERRSLRQAPGPRSRVFISYRDQDAAADVSAIRQAVDSKFGPNTVFRDSDAIPLAANWKTEVTKALAESAAVLIVIGPAWTCSSAIEFELRRAIANHGEILPVFVRGARADLFERGLPSDLRGLAELTGAEVNHRHFERDIEAILSRLSEIGFGVERRQGTSVLRWWIESARRSGGPGLMGGEVQLVDENGGALHLAVRYDADQVGHVRVDGRGVRWQIPPGVPTHRPPRHGFRFTVFSSGRRETMELILEWSSRRALRRRESPVSLSLSCDGREVTAMPK